MKDLISSISIDFNFCAAKDFILSNQDGGEDLKENILIDLSLQFSVKIVKLCENIKGHYSITNQLERSSTSVGANIREANYAHGKADFIAKLQISLKECFESEYWLELMYKSGIIEETTALDLIHDCGVLRRILISSINTAKAKMKKQ